MKALVDLEDAQVHLRELVEKVESGDEVLITRENRPVARLSAPVEGAANDLKPRKFGSSRGLIEMAPDFDAPLEDFAEYS